MDGLLRHRADRLFGILNGIDTAAWDPATDPHLAAGYDRARLVRKARNKQALQRECGLDEDATLPLFGIVSRLTRQKGLDLLPPLAAELVGLPAQLVVLGSGDRDLEQAFHALAQAQPGRVAVRIGFDEALAHRIEAGADIFLMPSRFEPCGLNQMYSLRYGTPPLVRATGGLADTVIDADADRANGNGFVFGEATGEALLATMRRAVAAWRMTRRWRGIQRRGMDADLGWTRPAAEYVRLYNSIARR